MNFLPSTPKKKAQWTPDRADSSNGGGGSLTTKTGGCGRSAHHFGVVRMGPGCATVLLLERQRIHHRENPFHLATISSLIYKTCLRINNNTLSGQRPSVGAERHQCNLTRIPTGYYTFVPAHALVDMRFPSRALIKTGRGLGTAPLLPNKSS